MGKIRTLALAATMALPFWPARAAETTPPSLAPVPQRGDRWESRHAEKLRQVADQAGEIDLVFIGDSITQGLERPGSAEIVTRAFPGKTLLNLGYNADKTENVLWRLRNGEIDGIAPEAVVLMIGTNNTGHRQDPPETTAKAIGQILEELRAKLPNAKIALLSIFPRSDGPGNVLQSINDKTNALLPALADGKSVFHFDLNEVFFDANGTIPPETMPDGLHPSAKGDELWIGALKTRLEQMLKGSR
jgi:lysophospholipase L1-like esterase